MKIAFSCLVLIAVLAVVELADAQECYPGQNRQLNCNMCRCVNYNWACTRKICVNKRDVKIECLPGQVKQLDCNTCTCANGLWGCTRKLCVPQAGAPEWQGECIEGSDKMKDCNTCKCINGAWSCTRNHCVSKRQTKCTPNSRYMKQCNQCTCSADGQSEACTLRLCY